MWALFVRSQALPSLESPGADLAVEHVYECGEYEDCAGDPEQRRGVRVFDVSRHPYRTPEGRSGRDLDGVGRPPDDPSPPPTFVEIAAHRRLPVSKRQVAGER